MRLGGEDFMLSFLEQMVKLENMKIIQANTVSELTFEGYSGKNNLYFK